MSPKTRIAPSFALSVNSLRISRSSDGLMSLPHASFAAARTTSQQALPGGHRTADDLHRLLVVAFHRDFQPFFAFAAVDGQNAVSRRAQNRFAVIRILRVNAFALFGGDGTQHAVRR